VTAAKIGDERFIVGIRASCSCRRTSLSGSAAIASDTFNGGNHREKPVSGRDVYRSAITFRPVRSTFTQPIRYGHSLAAWMRRSAPAARRDLIG